MSILRNRAQTPDAPPVPESDELQRYEKAVRSRKLARTTTMVTRWGLYAVIGILAVLGLRNIITGPPPAEVVAESTTGQSDLAAQTFAADFARTYLSYGRSEASREQRQAALESFPSTMRDTLAYGMTPPEGKEQTVTIAQVSQNESASRENTRAYTVLAVTAQGRYLALSVPVARSSEGLFISDYPAFIGAPAADTAPPTSSRPTVRDRSLVEVAERAVTNYLRGEANDLNADLTNDAQVGMPTEVFEVKDVPSVRWTSPGTQSSVLVTVDAVDKRGGTYRLSYEMNVVQTVDRWQISAIQALPTTP